MIARLFAVSLLSGVALGLGGRLVMRFIALGAGHPGSFSIGGTLEVLSYGALVGTPVALLFLLFRSRVPIPVPWAGGICGLLLFVALAVLRSPSVQSALAETPDAPLGTMLAFGMLFLLWGMALDYAGRLVLRPSRPR